MKYIKLSYFLLLQICVFSSFVIAQNSEKHLKNIKQLTFGGDNAEAYFSPNGKKFSFQSNYKNWGLQCDQIFMMQLNHPIRDSFSLKSGIF